MAWNTPKVDWTSTDYFNVEDWDRIRENTEYVNQYLAEAGYKTHSLLDTMLDRNNLTLPTVSLVNKLEENLQLVLTDLLSNPPNALNMVTWHGVTTTSYQRNPNSDDWNRWESVVALLKEDLDYISSYTYYKASGAYVSGQYSQLWRVAHKRYLYWVSYKLRTSSNTSNYYEELEDANGAKFLSRSFIDGDDFYSDFTSSSFDDSIGSIVNNSIVDNAESYTNYAVSTLNSEILQLIASAIGG